jgi:hypothetical protein
MPIWILLNSGPARDIPLVMSEIKGVPREIPGVYLIPVNPKTTKGHPSQHPLTETAFILNDSSGSTSSIPPELHH